MSINSQNSALKEGELVLFNGRLAEVLLVGSLKGPGVVEVIDEGGIPHDFILQRHSNIERLDRRGECALDEIVRASGPELTPADLRARIAERWLAKPQAGDVFLVEDGYLLELTEIWVNGVIIGVQHPYRTYYPLKKKQGVSFDNARTLRRWLKLPTHPVYRCIAHSTKRELPPAESQILLGT